MGLRGITLNTPPEEEAHIIAEDDAAIYQSIFGEDGVFTIGDRMKATVINNNQVRVSNGVICVGGHIARTVYGDYSDMTIENGEISKNRNDIITAVFSTTGEKGIDKFKIEVKKGTPGVVAEDPELTKENLYEGGKLRELPLWRVKLEGINIIGVEQMFKIIHKIPDLEEMIESLNGKMENFEVDTMEELTKSYGFTVLFKQIGALKIIRIAGNPNGQLTTHNIGLPEKARARYYYSTPTRVGSKWGEVKINGTSCSIKMDTPIDASAYVNIWSVYI